MNNDRLPFHLRLFANLIGNDEWWMAGDMCRKAAAEIEYWRARALGDPTEPQIEEGDRANG
jgi:hypothetical protein